MMRTQENLKTEHGRCEALKKDTESKVKKIAASVGDMTPIESYFTPQQHNSIP